MGRIGERFAALRARGERALVPFLTAGDPDLDATEGLVLALADAGADLIELRRCAASSTSSSGCARASGSRCC
jgi:tryptophan synthase alpha chain